MGGGSIDIVHHPSYPVLCKYHEASFQLPWCFIDIVHHPSSLVSASKNKEKKKQQWKDRKENVVQKSKSSCIHCKKNGHDDEHCSSLYPYLKPKKFNGKKNKVSATIQNDLGLDSSDEKQSQL